MFSALLAIAMTFSAGAAVNVIGYWRLGESDPGAANGASAVTATDSAASHNLAFAGQARYASDVSPAAFWNTGSSLSVNFQPPNAYARGNLVSTAQDNFGVEAWVKPAPSAGVQILVYNGDTATSGWGIIIIDSVYKVLFGGQIIFGSAAATPNVWAHVAVVRDRGVCTLYVNGIPSGTSDVIPNLPNGNFGLATPPQSPGSQLYPGLMDEVRVFTFAAGQFTPDDLLLGAASVTTGGASDLSVTSATITGTVNPKGLVTTARFLFGTTINYGSATPSFNVGSGSVDVAAPASLVGLTPATLYHYVLIASNSAGVAVGADRTFSTRVPELVPMLQPGDAIRAIDSDVASFSSYPNQEGPPNALDGIPSTKYLNFAGRNSGFIVTLSAGPSPVRSIRLTTANDFFERDPSSYALYGTHDPIFSPDNSDGQRENWTLISSGSLNLPNARLAASGPVLIPNATAYWSYRLVFPTLKAGPEMQIADVGFFGTPDGSGPNLLRPFDSIVAIHMPTSQSRSPSQQGPTNALDGNPLTQYLNFGKENSGFIVTPFVGRSVLKAFQFTTADDFLERDPAAWALYGTDAPIQSTDNSTGTAEPWTLIDQGYLNLPFDRFTAGPLIAVANNTPYTSYRMVIPTLRNTFGAMVDSVQYSGIQFYQFTPYILIRRAGANVVINFSGVLQSATNVTGPYQDISGATTPYQLTPPDLVGRKFFRTRY